MAVYTTIDNPGLFFNTVLWSGNSSTQSVTGVGFQPDWVWVKNRSASQPNIVQDIVRGKSGSNFQYLFTNTTAAEAVQPDNDGIQSFDTDGFSMNHTDSGGWNESGSNYVGWSWKAGGTASSNSDGSITSSVSANTTAGFSIVSYTGTGSNATVGHGLGVAPSMIIIKARSATESWTVYHKDLTSAAYNLTLNDTSAEANNPSHFNSTAPTSSVFSIGTSGRVNVSSQTQIAYCFAGKQGYSKFGSLTGNGNADGAFVYTGFKPAWIMYKRTNSGADDSWVIADNKRDIDNVVQKYIFADQSNAEGTTNFVDFLSNGFKYRLADNTTNGSGNSYIYMAFAENPFVTAGTKAAGTAR